MELTKAVIFFVGFLVAVCSGLPASRSDVELVNPVKTYGDQPIVDTGMFSGWESPFSGNPFGGLFDNLEGIMERMRQQIASLLNRFPLTKGSNSTEDIFPTGLQPPGFPDIGGIDLSKGNTTSITKVIDGHTVVINETEYKNEDDFGGTFFKVRIIDVKPDSSELTTEKEAEAVPENATAKDREEVADSIENEIPKSKEAEVVATIESQDNVSLYDNLEKSDDPFQNIETFDDVESFENTHNTPTFSTNTHSIEPIEHRFSTNNEWSDEETPETVNPEWSFVSPVKPLDSNTIDSREQGQKEYDRQLPIDLSGDIYVNELLAKSGAPTNPDAEVFVVENVKNPRPFEQFIDPR